MLKPSSLRPRLAVCRHALDPAGVPQLAQDLLADPRAPLLNRLIELLFDPDSGIANRAADTLERITADTRLAENPSIDRALQRSKEALLGLLPEAQPIKLRWNLALVLPRLRLTRAEARRAAAILESWLNDRSSIVKTCALDGLAHLTAHDPTLRPQVLDLLRIHGRSGTPAMRARSRHLLARLEPSVNRALLGPRLRTARKPKSFGINAAEYDLD